MKNSYGLSLLLIMVSSGLKPSNPNKLTLRTNPDTGYAEFLPAEKPPLLRQIEFINNNEMQEMGRHGNHFTRQQPVEPSTHEKVIIGKCSNQNKAKKGGIREKAKRQAFINKYCCTIS